jgi:O-antigen/teichoic acid export membrane protein
LGKYVAILTLAGLINVVSRVFLETLLPSLSTVLARRNYVGASEVFVIHLRILFAITISAACTLAFLVDHITAILGKQYAGERTLFVLLSLLYGLGIPGTAGGTLLTSTGKQQRSVIVGLGQLALFGGLFAALWPRYHLLGAVIATGGSFLIASIVLLVTARHSGPILFSYFKSYVWAAIIICAVAVDTLRLYPLSLLHGVVGLILAIGAFLILGGYSRRELRFLASCIMPNLDSARALLRRVAVIHAVIRSDIV